MTPKFSKCTDKRQKRQQHRQEKATWGCTVKAEGCREPAGLLEGWPDPALEPLARVQPAGAQPQTSVVWNRGRELFSASESVVLGCRHPRDGTG